MIDFRLIFLDHSTYFKKYNTFFKSNLLLDVRQARESIHTLINPCSHTLFLPIVEIRLVWMPISEVIRCIICPSIQQRIHKVQLLYYQKNFGTAKHKYWLPGLLACCKYASVMRACSSTFRVYYTIRDGPVNSTCVSHCWSSFGSTIINTICLLRSTKYIWCTNAHILFAYHA